MKERLLDIIKWTIIFIIGAGIFYFVYPKYEVVYVEGAYGNKVPYQKMNKITGEVESWR